MALNPGLDPPPPFMANAILNFHFDYLNPSLMIMIAINDNDDDNNR